MNVDSQRFNFNTLSPDDYVKKMQSEGKTRQQQHQNPVPTLDVTPSFFFHVQLPIDISELHEEPIQASKSKPTTPKPSGSRTPTTPIESKNLNLNLN